MSYLPRASNNPGTEWRCVHVFMIILVYMCVTHIITNKFCSVPIPCKTLEQKPGQHQIIIWPKYLFSSYNAWDSYVSFTSKPQVASKLPNNSKYGGFGIQQRQWDPDFKSCLFMSTECMQVIFTPWSLVYSLVKWGLGDL